MSFQDTEPTSDPGAGQPRSASEQWGAWSSDEKALPASQAGLPGQPAAGPPPTPQPGAPVLPVNPQFTLREHVSGQLPVHPSEAPMFRPAYNPYPQFTPQAGLARPLPPPPPGVAPGQPYPSAYRSDQSDPAGAMARPSQYYPPPYNGYLPPRQGYQYPYGYPSPYGNLPYGWSPRPKRDSYQFAVSIISTIGAGLALLGGLISALFLLVTLVIPNTSVSTSDLFSSVMLFLALTIAGLVGGGFCLYHSIRALNRKPSALLRLPWFWIPLILYLFVLGIGYALQVNGLAVTSWPLTILMIILAAVFPALTLAALGVRRLRIPAWPTTWRRFTLALVSGATLSILLALVLELGLSLLALRTSTNLFNNCIDNPNGSGCDQVLQFNILFLIIAVIGPIVEETVKPLGVALYSGRLRSAAEAFTLGMAAGIGFALVETVGYIGQGYQDWLSVALVRTGSSLLHGFGAGMVALGWYYFAHRKQGGSILIAVLCWLYAVFQHLVWNGTTVLGFLPAPVGPALGNWNINLGFTSLPGLELLNIIEAILILVFFIYMTGRLRKRSFAPPSPPDAGYKPSPSGDARVAARA